MKKTNAVFALLVASLLTPQASSQSRPTGDELASNLDRAVGTLELDRTQYFIGEEIKLTHRLRNPTPLPLIVPAPLSDLLGRFRFLPVDEAGATVWVPPIGSQVVMPGVATSLDLVPIITIAPSATVTSQVTSSQDLANQIQLPAAPEGIGRYELRYSYDGSFRRLNTVAPVFDSWAQAPTGLTGTSLDGETYSTHRVAFALRQGETSYVCIVADPKRASIAEFAADWSGRRVAAGWVSYFSPYRRVATISGRVAQLSVSVDALGNTTIIAVDQAGVQSRIDLDANFNQR